MVLTSNVGVDLINRPDIIYSFPFETFFTASHQLLNLCIMQLHLNDQMIKNFEPGVV
jgi:hypothetical protein